MSIIREALFKTSLNVQNLVDIETGESFLSRPVNKINIPEVKNVKAEFVYNYFTKDERVRPDSRNLQEKIVNLEASSTDEIFNKANSEKLARYVRISFASIKAPENYVDSNISINTTNINVEKIADKMIAEGTVPNTVFTGVEILDTGKEKSLYKMLNSSMYFTDIPVDRDSNLGAVSRLYQTLSEKGGLRGQDKKIIREAFRNIASEGYKLSESDVHPSVAKTSSDPIGKQTFSIQFNNLFMNDITKSALKITDNVFQDEMRSIDNISKDIQESTLNNIPEPHTLKEVDYELQVEALDTQVLDGVNSLEDALSRYKNFPDVKVVGYILEKFEVLPDENVELVNRMYIDGFNSKYAIDENVRYGGSYFYKIRTVCRVKFVGQIDNHYYGGIDQIGLITCFMASEGKTIDVYCVENTPPPEPTNLNLKFDFETMFPKLRWQLPLNKQRDIKRFQVFKRSSIKEAFRLIKEIEFDDGYIKGVSSDNVPGEDVIKTKYPITYFLDTTYKQGEKAIYAICSIDAHGLSSGYSMQVMIERDRITNKAKTKVISRHGAPKPYPNLFLNNDTFQDAIKTSRYDRIKIVFDPEYYDVVKNKITNSNSDATTVEEVSLNLLAIDDKNFRYKFHFINIDNQKDKLVDVKITTKASPASTPEEKYEVAAAELSGNNISFQYGL
jgi:hypothetical protein